MEEKYADSSFLHKPSFASCIALLLFAESSFEGTLLIAVIDLQTFINDAEKIKLTKFKECILLSTIDALLERP